MSNPNDPSQHEVDGIKEDNHPLPKWWIMSFYLSIAFSLLYIAYYHLGSGPSLNDDFKQEMESLQAAATQAPPVQNAPIDLGAVSDKRMISEGRAIYLPRCASCHGPEGQGGIGPNLTDRYWLHGKGTPEDLLKVIREGVQDKGMPAWGSMLSPTELVKAVAFVHSLKGATPTNPKAPQGQEIP